jgi:sigma-B regulation protein RsbU (phosphoserine phosphatase)
MPTGPALGVFDDKTWALGTIYFAPGDALVLYTDGVTEARNAEGTLFDEDRLHNSVSAKLGSAGSPRPSAQEVQDTILADVSAFAGDLPPSDDIALLVLIRE